MKKLITMLIFIGIINIANAQFFVGADLKGGFGNAYCNKDNTSEGSSTGGNLRIGYEFLNHFSLSTGFSTYRINYKETIAIQHVSDPPPIAEYSTFKDHINYYSIPLKLGYFFQPNRVRLFANIGLMSAKSEESTSTYKSGWNLAYSGEIGVGYQIKENFLLTLSGEYIKHCRTRLTDRSLTSAYYPDYYYNKPYFYGLNLGVRYYF